MTQCDECGDGECVRCAALRQLDAGDYEDAVADGIVYYDGVDYAYVTASRVYVDGHCIMRAASAPSPPPAGEA